MKTEIAPQRLDVAAFAAAASSLSGQMPLHALPRLSAESPEAPSAVVVDWHAEGEERLGAAGVAVPWLHLVAGTAIPLVCQRCLALVETVLAVDRRFRFAADEEAAALEDEESEEDVLAISREFDLKALIEDELLMEIPVTPRHEVCPEAPRLSAVDDDFAAASEARTNAFAALDGLRPRKPE